MGGAFSSAFSSAFDISGGANMPIHDEDTQRDLGTHGLSPVDNGKSVTPFFVGARIYRESSTWFVDDGDNEAGVEITGGQYTPPFHVRGISTLDNDDTNGRIVEFDLAGPGMARANAGNLSIRLRERLVFGVIYPFWITRVHLGPTTDALSINLWG